jgi:hypothetical protein
LRTHSLFYLYLGDVQRALAAALQHAQVRALFGFGGRT